MDIKVFMRDPLAALATLGLEKTDTARKLVGSAEEIRAGRVRLKQLKSDKAAVARAFKSVPQGSSEHRDLVARMQTVSDVLKELEASVKAREKALRESLASIVSPPAKAPPFYHVPINTYYRAPFTVVELGTAQLEGWRRFVARQKQAPLYCHGVWPEVIADAFGHKTRVWAAVSESGEILGGVPLTFLDSRLFGRFAVSVPYFNYGGVISPYMDVAQALFQELTTVCQREALSHIEVRTMQSELWPQVASKKVSMVLPLPKDEARLEEQLGAKVRAQCKKAEPHAPEIRFGHLALLDDFYRVFAINMRDLGTPVYAKSWFRCLLNHSDIEATLAVVYVQGQPVSTGFLLGHNGMLEIPWASTVKAANTMDTNMWMYRQILGFAVREGYEFFDFGRSTRDAGTYRFKKQWGAQPYEHYWYYVLPEGGAVPGLNPDNPKYRLLINAWKLMPVWLTKIIGPPLVKNIP